MTNLKKDILVGVLSVTGVFGFMSGEYIISTCLFATATILSNVLINSSELRD